MQRHDLVNAPTNVPLAQRVAEARALLEDAVRPEWRRDLLVMVRPEHMSAICGVSRCRREAVSNGMCNGHALRWNRLGRPALNEFVTTTDHVLRGHHVLKSCSVTDCRLGRSEQGLCWRHVRQWTAAGRPDKTAWVATAVADTTPTATCHLPNCDLAAEGRSPYCRSHYVRWRNHGKPPHEDFEAAVMNYGDPRWDFRRLPEQLKIELQYALQRDQELGFARSAHSCSWVIRMLVNTGATTLLEHDRDTWRRMFVDYVPNPKQSSNGRAFLGFALDQLIDLIEGSGWDREYPRDVWQLHRLGYMAAGATRRLNFTDIGQQWLVDTAKRWLHWRLTVEEKSINTICADLLSIRRLSTFLTETGQAEHSIRQLTRPVLEHHVTWLHDQPHLASASIRDSISAIAVFLRALQDHESWAPICRATPSSTPPTIPASTPCELAG